MVAQPVANFSSSKSSGCSPLTGVQFLDLSTGSPTSWVWKRNGVQFSTLQNPTATFTSPGSYVINLTASNSSGSSSTSQTITVFSNPTSNFAATSATAGCNPLTVAFQDNSTSSSSAIASRLWSFGDGGQSALTNPNHTYTLSGNFPVSLKVIDGNGCEDTKQIPNYIQVYPLPNVSFSSNSVRQSCAPPLTIAFNNNSTGTGTLTYQWNFGDGTGSTAASPSHTYNAYGTFNVKLVVTDNNACSDSVILNAFVKIQPLVANFSLSDDSICLGDSVNLVQTSSNAVSYAWNFGDLSSGKTGSVVSHTYQDSGLFNIRMIAGIGVSGCTDTAYKNVYVQQVIADFTPSQQYICQLPQTVVYLNNSINGDEFRWHRGINCPNIPGLSYNSCGTWTGNPVIQYSSSSRGGQNVEGLYADTLIAISNLGCRDTAVIDTSIIINLVRSGPILNQNSFCRPFTINFNYVDWPFSPLFPTTSTAPTITSYEWIIDDTLYSSLKTPPNLIHTDTGLWIGTLKVENSLGCRDSISFWFAAGDKQIPSFYMSSDTVCADELDTAFVTSQDTNYITGYQFITTPSSQQGGNKQFYYFNPSDTGWHTVTHIVDHHGCKDTLVKDSAFYVSGPIVNILIYTPFTCTDTTKLSLTSDIQGASKFIWDFGDTAVPKDSVNPFPVVNYPKTGNYIVTLTAYNGDSSCVASDFIIVGAYPTAAVLRSDLSSTPFSPPPGPGAGSFINDTLEGCVPFEVSFSGMQSPGLLLCDWIIDGQLYQGLEIDSILSYTFNQRGYYDIVLIGYDTLKNCVDTARMVIGAYEPKADFIGMPNTGCAPLNAVLKDSSTSLIGLRHIIWNVASSQDTGQFYSRTFTGVTTEDVQLVVIDSFGCRDTLIKEDYIKTSNFSIFFYATGNRQLCTGDSIGFLESLFTPNITYLWLFGDGDSSTLANPNHIYNDSGTFDVTLIARNTSGCEKIQLRPTYIEVQQTPVAEFSADRTDSTCYPLPVQFSADTGIVYYDDNDYFYALGDFQAASNYKDPFYNYVRPGSYTVSLKVTTSFGCTDTEVKVAYINVGGPYGELLLSPDTICRGDSVTFEMVNDTGVTLFAWDFGDGTDTSLISPVSHRYNDSVGFVFPNLVLTDTAHGCAKTFEDTLYIFETIADFSYTDSLGCVSYNPAIVNTSTFANTFFWDFGNGNISNGRNPSVTYTEPGVYPVVLGVSNAVGCTDTLRQNFYVFPLPEAYAENDTLICEGDTVQLFASGGVQYSWSPPAYLSNSFIFDPLAFPVNSGAYSVAVTDTNNCTDVATITILVQNPIYVNLPDLSLIIGDTVTLLKGNPAWKYRWEPPLGLSCDSCPNPLLTALESGTYSVTITDTNGCFEATTLFNLEVVKEYSLDVPAAFTPNGDGVNDVIYARGWGLKELQTFKIYNRWGELLFESNELSQGWDGTYKGQLQGVETYVYYVEGLSYSDVVLKKKGTINLLR
ncbi:MAG: PKD domain-containing protein [Vicingaceae bacterium]